MVYASLESVIDLYKKLEALEKRLEKLEKALAKRK